jgi:hypothetical protein
MRFISAPFIGSKGNKKFDMRTEFLPVPPKNKAFLEEKEKIYSVYHV